MEKERGTHSVRISQTLALATEVSLIGGLRLSGHLAWNPPALTEPPALGPDGLAEPRRLANQGAGGKQVCAPLSGATEGAVLPLGAQGY